MVYRRLDELIRLLDKNFLSRFKSMYRLEREGITRWGKVMLKITEKELWNTSIFLEGVSTLNECNEKVGKLWPELEKLREFELEIRSSKAH